MTHTQYSSTISISSTLHTHMCWLSLLTAQLQLHTHTLWKQQWQWQGSRVCVQAACAGHWDGPSARCSRRSCRRHSARCGGDGSRAAGAGRAAASSRAARRQQKRRCKSKQKNQRKRKRMPLDTRHDTWWRNNKQDEDRHPKLHGRQWLTTDMGGGGHRPPMLSRQLCANNTYYCYYYYYYYYCSAVNCNCLAPLLSSSYKHTLSYRYWYIYIGIWWY